MKNIKNKFKQFLFLVISILLFCNFSLANENFFNEAKEKFEQKDFKESKFLFQRNIVFNPMHAKSYLYLAKIFEVEKNESEKIKNINTTLLLEPNNEEAMYMLIKYELKKSNFSRVNELKKNFLIIFIELCGKNKKIEDSLKDIEPKNES